MWDRDTPRWKGRLRTLVCQTTQYFRHLIPVLADYELPDTLRRYKYLDFREEAFAELLTACRLLVGKGRESTDYDNETTRVARGRPVATLLDSMRG